MRIEEEIPERTAAAYVERVNRAIDHVVQNLDRPHRLEELARVAGFSPFHFHRVFQTVTGETLGQFTKRVRLERVLFLMSHAPGRSLTDVALACGFSSSSDFSRSFKQRYGVPPSAFDVATFRREGSRELEAVALGESSGHRVRRLAPGENPDGFEAVLRDLPARTVAYIRVRKPYEGDGVVRAAGRLEAWAEERGLADGAWLAWQWDDPEIVALADCRYDIGVVVDDPDAFEPAGEIGRIVFPPMRVAEVELRGTVELELRALDWLFRTWLPSSGYVPSDQPCFEAFLGRPFAHGAHETGHFELCAHLPVARF